ncbi:unnamed protein product [Schistocephalus solidus]|uniref:WD_REPEATS_REGION domain-containing protein n=1 Tax=Schistocephalus solidus TaxID=70667 RepID=A0A183TC96_SCHSO|nr:unnamed protein product [Schistocephalus solidus]
MAKCHLGDDEVVIGSSVGAWDRICHQHVLPLDEPAPWSGVHSGHLVSHRKAEEGIGQDEPDGLVNYSNSEDSEPEHEGHQVACTTSIFFTSSATGSLTPPDPPSPTDFWRTTILDREPLCVQESASEVPVSPVTSVCCVSPPWQPPEIINPRAPDVGIELDASAYRHLKKKRKRLNPTAAANLEASEKYLGNLVAQKPVASEESASEKAEVDNSLYKRLSFACECLPPGSWNTDGFYPRCSICWPFLAVSCPVGKLNGTLQFGIQIWKFAAEPLAAHRVATLGDSGSPPSGRVVWLRLLTKQWLAVAYETGFLSIWDHIKGIQVSRINVSGCCGRRLRAVSVALGDSDNIQPCFLVAGDAPCISLWDLRIGREDTSRTHGLAQRFNYQGYAVSTSDLLWLAHSGHFASCTDTVQRDVTDKSVAVWDLRLQSIVSRQLYQERWGCSRMALARTGQHTCRIAVQTQGGGIVEVVGGRDAKRQYRMRKNLTSDDTSAASLTPLANPPLAPISYRLERRWRYEKHETQAHPLGLAYSPDNRLLASGCWGSDGPVVYRSPWRKGPHSSADDEGEDAAADCLRLGRTTRGILVSDVAWLPIGTLEADSQALVAVRNNCELDVYRCVQPT